MSFLHDNTNIVFRHHSRITGMFIISKVEGDVRACFTVREAYKGLVLLLSVQRNDCNGLTLAEWKISPRISVLRSIALC